VASVRWAAETGGVTLIGLALSGLVLMTGLIAVDIGALVIARAAAQTAADMAALAALTPVDVFAAPRPPTPGPPPGPGSSGAWDEGWGASSAVDIATANGADLVMCECSAVQALVRVRRRVGLVPGGLSVTVTATARAVLGPPPATSRPTVPPADLLRGGFIT
jgi:hypothetical protein